MSEIYFKNKIDFIYCEPSYRKVVSRAQNLVLFWVICGENRTERGRISPQ